jgi:hypothetical protein
MPCQQVSVKTYLKQKNKLRPSVFSAADESQIVISIENEISDLNVDIDQDP